MCAIFLLRPNLLISIYKKAVSKFSLLSTTLHAAVSHTLCQAKTLIQNFVPVHQGLKKLFDWTEIQSRYLVITI